MNFMSNVQEKKMETSARSAALGEGPEDAEKALERGQRRRLLRYRRRPGSKRQREGPSEGTPGGGPENQRSSHGAAALGRGPLTGSRQRPNKHRRLKKKMPKLPQATCISIGIFRE